MKYRIKVVELKYQRFKEIEHDTFTYINSDYRTSSCFIQDYFHNSRECTISKNNLMEKYLNGTKYNSNISINLLLCCLANLCFLGTTDFLHSVLTFFTLFACYLLDFIKSMTSQSVFWFKFLCKI